MTMTPRLLLLMATLACGLHHLPGAENRSVNNDERAADWTQVQIKQSLKGKPNTVTPMRKSFPDSFPGILTQRGQPLVYTKGNSNNLKYIGMPIGGLCAGQLYLSGDGVLRYWDIFNHGKKRGEMDYKEPQSYEEPPKVANGFAIRTRVDNTVVSKSLNKDSIAEIGFTGQYPVGLVSYRDPQLPVTVDLTAFSPFIPTQFADSAIPATVMRWTIRNPGTQAVHVNFGGWLANKVGCLSGTSERLHNRAIITDSAAVLHGTATSAKKNAADYGSMSLALLNPGKHSHIVPHLQGDKDHPPHQGLFTQSNHAPTEATIPLNKTGLLGGVATTFTVQPGEEHEVDFVVSWHFANTRHALNKRNRNTKRWYNNHYANSLKVIEDIAERSNTLINNTLTWHKTWYDSTLPFWFLDRSLLNVSILATGTCDRYSTGEFHGYEGVYQGKGTCIHVWGYVQAMGRLFPELEVALREKTDFKGWKENHSGKIGYRGPGTHDAVDGQAAILLRTYLTHQMSQNDTFLRNNWSNIKKSLMYLIENYDSDRDGILTGSQHNTLDANWTGKVAWFCLLYNAALKATEQMALEMGDQDFALLCRQLAAKGRSNIERDLFNGEYFIQLASDGPGTYTGCSYLDAIGPSWAAQLGLGELVDPQMLAKYLDSLWTYNFTTDVGPFREIQKAGRWYAMPGEAAMVGCTWPQGGSEVLKRGKPRFAAYNNESMNGFEYTVTGLMMWSNRPWIALAHTWYMHHNRYHGAKRNPWNEIEWGTHYSRSMASYGLLTAICGFEYHGPKGHIGFAPKITPHDFKAPFTAAASWGTYSQHIEGNSMMASIKPTWGELHVKTIALQAPAEAQIVSVTMGGHAVASSFVQNNNQVAITLHQPIVATAKDAIVIKIK